MRTTFEKITKEEKIKCMDKMIKQFKGFTKNDNYKDESTWGLSKMCAIHFKDLMSDKAVYTYNEEEYRTTTLGPQNIIVFANWFNNKFKDAKWERQGGSIYCWELTKDEVEKCKEFENNLKGV